MISRIIKLAIIFLIVGVHSMLFTGLAPGEETQVWTRQLQALRPRPQAAANDTIRVESGIASIANNAKVEFSAGNSPQFSAVNSATPAESRIDLLVINSSGTLEIIQGTQAATPSAPAYPSDKLAIAEVTITEVSPASPVITDTDIKDVRFFLNLGGGVSTATDNAYINVTGDTMTGVLTLSPASGNALVTTAGNVGIGTASPGAALDVAGAIRSSNGLTVSAGAVSLPANSINDTMVSDTLTASDLVASTGVVDSTEIVDAAIANVDIAANAAISGTKVDPNFGSQSIITSGSVGIGTTNVDSSALLDITSIAKGFLPPRM
ncbi:MAG: hypothetical protein Q8O12_04150, partial [Candidatus Omnitrophota bacterium]|nr:hypothetical protein [Candidatus Omnitrophota bacterium]